MFIMNILHYQAFILYLAYRSALKINDERRPKRLIWLLWRLSAYKSDPNNDYPWKSSADFKEAAAILIHKSKIIWVICRNFFCNTGVQGAGLLSSKFLSPRLLSPEPLSPKGGRYESDLLVIVIFILLLMTRLKFWGKWKNSHLAIIELVASPFRGLSVYTLVFGYFNYLYFLVTIHIIL